MKSLTVLATRWQALAPREQRLLGLAAWLIGLALLWWVALAPALNTLRGAPARHAGVDRQLQQMQALQAEARQLQATPPARVGDAQALLRSSLTQHLGNTAQLQIVGDRATVTLQAAPAPGLALWLAEARSNARAQVLEARLNRSAQASPVSTKATKPADATTRWDGSLVLALPANR